MLKNAGCLEVLQALQLVYGVALVRVQGGKAPEKFWPFYIWRANK